MNCEDFESNVNDLAREQLMDADVRTRSLAHSEECSACARRLANESALSFKLRMLAADVAADERPVLGETVLAALRERQAPLMMKTTQARLRFGVWAVAATAVAALILIAIAVGVVRVRPTPPTARIPSPPVTRDDPGQKNVERDPQLVTGVQLIDKAPPKPEGGVKKRSNRNVLNRASLSATTVARISHNSVAGPSVTVSYSIEVATDFFPVTYGNPSSLGDGGQLVRVELPRSALVAFGLPMNVDRYNEKVKAEVLYGLDGMAHAIRFVQ